MGRTITRRDFMNGAAMLVGASMLPSNAMGDAERLPGPQNRPGYDPPLLTGMRGSHPGSFETAHSLRDGTFWSNAGTPISLREKYDLVVVGSGISGLAAAHFFRERFGNSARILILENHDDFGGHAKRNEFHLAGRLALLNGGTLEIDSPTPYSREAAGLIQKLGIDPPAFEKNTPTETSINRWGYQRVFSSIRKLLAPISSSSACRNTETVPERRAMNPPPGESFSPELRCLQLRSAMWRGFRKPASTTCQA
jgi:NAD(P)-binding Rossmann-like domain